MIPTVREFAVAIAESLALSLIVKATVVAGAVLVAARLARRRRASIRHLMSATAFVVLLALPLAAAVVPLRPVAMPILEPAPSPAATPSAPVLALPAAVATAAAARPAEARQWPRVTRSVGTVLLAAWVGGTAIVLAQMMWGLVRIRRVCRTGVPWLEGDRLVASAAAALGTRRSIQVLLDDRTVGPMTCGVFHPAIILPRDARQWAVEDLRHALVHEVEHVRRADWLTLCGARSVCAVYWFHPLVWMLWRQLRLEAERACDDAVLRTADPATYADQLVMLAERLVSKRTQSALAMANRDDLSARVSAVLDGRQPRGRAGSLWVTGAAVAAAVLVVAMAPLRAVAVSRKTSQQVSPTRSEMTSVRLFRVPPRAFGVAVGAAVGRTVLAPSKPVQQPPQSTAEAVAALSAQTTAPSAARLGVVSVKPCNPDDNAGGGRGGGGARPSPGRLLVPCRRLRGIIRMAFIPGLNPRENERLTGGPEWIDRERYMIEATFEGTPSSAVESGAMLHQILADRFQLRVRREPRPVRVYSLVVSPRGMKVTPLPEGQCVQNQAPQPRPPRKPDCDLMTRATTEPVATFSRLLERTGQAWMDSVGANRTYHALPVTMDAVALFLDSILDRPVVNRTGLTGLFDIRLEYSAEGTLPAVSPEVLSADPPTAASIFTALQEQLGLQLEPTQTSAEVFVIESVQRPTPN